MGYQEFTIEGRNAVIEAFRSGKPIDKLFILDGCQDGPVLTIKREAKKQDTMVKFVPKERLDQMSETGKHQGVIAYAAAYEYAEVEDILAKAKEKGEPPFIFLLESLWLWSCLPRARCPRRRLYPRRSSGAGRWSAPSPSARYPDNNCLC